MVDFADKVVCITGASRGIGRAIAEAFAARSARMLLLARSDRLSESADLIRDEARVLALQCDVSERGQVNEAMATAIAKWGSVDVLINAAGVLGEAGVLWMTDPDTWIMPISVNLIGSYYTMRAALPHMISAHRGKVINFAGGGAAYGYPRFSAYAASKAAIVRLTETVAIETAPYNVQVNAVTPGAIETDMLRAVR